VKYFKLKHVRKSFEASSMRDSRKSGLVTLKELSERTGFTQQYLSDVENNRRIISQDKATIIEDALKGLLQ
jgi:transcriptional regulator with XRE-family HTH domain